MNKKIRAVLVDSDIEAINKVKQYFDDSVKIEVVNVSYNGSDALDYIIKEKDNIDVILMDSMLAEKDSLCLLKTLFIKNININIIMTTYASSSYTCTKAYEYGVKHVTIKPYDIEDIESIIVDLCKNNTNYELSKDIELKITKMLHSLGVPSHIKGYQYVKESIILIYKNPYIIGSITKKLYPNIANTFETTPSRVERAIRHAIEVSWSRGDYDYMEELFGNSVDYDKAKPTNSEFIATVADKLRLDLKK